MPVKLERKELTAQNINTASKRRVSGIPRPLKHLVIDSNCGGITHASKPTAETLPLATPQKTDLITQQAQPLKQQQQHQGDTVPPNNRNDKTPSRQIQQPIKTLTQMDNDPEVAVLELVPFSRQPAVNFGNVNLGSTRIRYAVLRNSSERQQQLKVISFPNSDKGFYIDATEFLIAPRAEICVGLAWTPKATGGLRETITLHDINRMRWRIALTGVGVVPKPQLPFQSRSSRAQVPRMYRRPSPNKVNRQLLSERNKLVFSPQRLAAVRRQQQRAAKPLTKIKTPSPNKKSQIIRKILVKQQQVAALSKSKEAAITIQSYVRGFLARKETNRQRLFLVSLAWFQSECRARIVREQFIRSRMAAIKVQKYFRGLLARREAERQRLFLKSLALFQSECRTHIARKRFLENKKAAITIQRYVRGFLARREAERQRLFLKSLAWFQSECRTHIARKRFLKSRTAAIEVQKYFRYVIARREVSRRRSFIVNLSWFQSSSRAYLERKQFVQVRQASIIIQRYCRGFLARAAAKRRRDLISSVIKLQSLSRTYLAKKRFNRTRDACITIQRHLRGLLARKEARRRRVFVSSVIWLQSLARAHLSRGNFLRSRAAAICLQKHTRGFLARREADRRRTFIKSVIWLQSQSKAYLVRRQFKRSVEAVFRIQLQSFRGSLNRLLES